MKKFLFWVVAVGMPLCVFGPAWAGEGQKTLAVLALSSHEDLACETSTIGEIGENSDLPTWLASMLRLYDEGRDGVYGLDKSRPWGAVVQLGDQLSAYGFVPVTDAEELGWELSSYIQSRTEVGNDVVRVVGTDGGQLYARPVGAWLLVSDCPEVLAAAPADPARLLGDMNQQYDVALRLKLKNVPAEQGKKLLAMLDNKLGSTLRRVASQQTMEAIGKVAYGLDEMTLGWSPRAGN